MALNEIDKALSDLETSIERLSAIYHQYFLGIERIEPAIQRKNVDRKIYELKKRQMNNTAQKFRLQMQIQKYNTHSNYWKRICQQIEDGTYKQHVMLAKRRLEQRDDKEERISRPPQVDESAGKGLDELKETVPTFELDLNGFSLDEPFERTSRAGEASGASTGKSLNVFDIDDPFLEAPPLAEPNRFKAPITKSKALTKKQEPAKQKPLLKEKLGLDDNRVEAIYKNYVAALKKCNQPIGDITMQKVGRSLKKKIEKESEILDFKVIIKDGKASIKAVKK